MFIGGLHRSGTTLLARCMAEHPAGERLLGHRRDRGRGPAPADRLPGGQRAWRPGPVRLRSRGPSDRDLAARRRREPRAGCSSSGARTGTRRGRVLVEKSPPNLIRTRFLQALFPGSRMIVLVRHPIAVAAATRQFGRARRTWKRMSYTLADRALAALPRAPDGGRPAIEHLLVMRYEEFVFDPDSRLGDAFRLRGRRAAAERARGEGRRSTTTISGAGRLPGAAPAPAPTSRRQWRRSRTG